MSRCGRAASLEALAMRELDAAEAVALRAHAEACPTCRHELRWLESERALFAQRGARDQVRQLWDERFGAPPRPHRARRVLVAAGVAAAALLALRLEAPAGRAPEPPPVARAAEPLMTLAHTEVLAAADLESSLGACLVMSPGAEGGACGPSLPASFHLGD